MITGFIGVVAFIIMATGVAGIIIRRNPLIMLMCIELMLNASNLLLVSIDRVRNVFDGQLFTLVLMAVAAAEVAVGLAMIVMIFRDEKVADVDDYHELSG